ncbi:MAG TPA: Dna2/Cas4 domain-containing protein [Candidatus Nitrosopelagicus sp.]|jgi:CRISPR-associated exonuclease Cas4|nr:Dna2/Cas4 domain-containing protein [Candidatus Nitrosopelagicus sp.]
MGVEGDRDYKQIVRDAIDSIGEDIEFKIDAKDISTIYLQEAVKCLRRSFYDRTDPLETEQTQFNKVLGGLFRKMKSQSSIGNYDMDGGLALKGQVDMIKDDVVLIFRSIDKFPENPMPVDILYVNACMWMFEKIEGVIVYITPDGKEDSFVTNRNQRMFEEVIRRTKVFHDLLNEKKVPIIEPSTDCQDCQYYERCYIRKKEGKTITIASLFGRFGKEDTI